MIAVTVVKWEREPVAAQLVSELMSHTDLDTSEAQALVREVLSAIPYEIRAESRIMATRVAEALRQCGAEVVVDDVKG